MGLNKGRHRDFGTCKHLDDITPAAWKMCFLKEKWPQAHVSHMSSQELQRRTQTNEHFCNKTQRFLNTDAPHTGATCVCRQALRQRLLLEKAAFTMQNGQGDVLATRCPKTIYKDAHQQQLALLQ